VSRSASRDLCELAVELALEGVRHRSDGSDFLLLQPHSLLEEFLAEAAAPAEEGVVDLQSIERQ